MFSKRANVVPLFEQKALALMISGGHLERHINRLKNYYRDVRSILLEKLSSLSFPAEIIETGSGLHLTVKFPSAKSDEQIIEEAAKRGIKIRCLSHYLLSPFSGCEKIAVINYSGLTKEKLIGFEF
jgi:GntR family transcriptional regulator/MocR family aminotransferase